MFNELRSYGSNVDDCCYSDCLVDKRRSSEQTVKFFDVNFALQKVFYIEI